MDISFLGGPRPQRGVGVVAPFDFALDRELWRWAPDQVSLHLTRTPFVPVEVSLDLARLVSEHETLREATHTLRAVSPEVVAYACTSGSFVGGLAGERAMCAAMAQAGEIPALTTSGALLEALAEIGARRIALVTPYTASVTQALEDYLAEGGVTVTDREFLGLTCHIWKVSYRSVVEMARRAVTHGADALFISCTNLPTYDAIPQLEAELRMPVLSANQVTMWSALRRIGERAVGPYQALLDPVARRGPASMTATAPPPAPPRAVPPAPSAAEEETPGAAATLGGPAVIGPAVFGPGAAGPGAAGPGVTGPEGLGAVLPFGDVRGEPEAAFAGAPGGVGAETEAADALDAPLYPDDPAGPAPL
ncbi:aspartate/glutamate racemase family protein [Streptomyces sp. F63]|uniref:maleate cis-trans isomerase family protein n=1 Tax=Streptomyces sp. F63 TaxID=2824887 RepID=UPI001B376B9E|nr:aspartate/glutamate racemase family protein [Streptomyces sp. F63]MBQ0983646.1 aspartate/glutamate racemase family protein [Streptomyces sp. F63]